MNFEFSQEQLAFRDMAADFAKKEIAPHAALWDKERHFPRDVLENAAAQGMAGLYVNEEHGGSGLSRVDAVVVFEELSKACPSTAAFMSIHNMVAWMIDSFGGDKQRSKFLPGLTSMKTVASYCLTEPDAGSDAASLKTKAKLDGEYYYVSGSKAFISGAGASDIYLVMVRTGGIGPKGISCLAIDKDTPGLSFGPQEKKLGWHSQPTAVVFFEDCKVPKENLIGKEGDGFKIAMAGLDGGRLNIGACSLGGAQACLEMATQYLKERKQFGKPLASFQALQFRIADMATELEAARLLLYKAAMLVQNKSPEATATAAMAKRMATDVGFEVVNRALQLHGGYGYLEDFPIERYLRDLRVHQILEGTNEIMRLIIARELLKD